MKCSHESIQKFARRDRSASRRWRPSCPRRSRPSRTSTAVLLCLGFIDRTPQGRIATVSRRAHLSGLGYEIPPPRRTEPGMPGLSNDSLRPPTRDGAIPRRGPAVRGHDPAAGERHDARPDRKAILTHGVVETPQFMPCGTNPTVRRSPPDGSARRAPRYPRQHLPFSLHPATILARRAALTGSWTRTVRSHRLGREQVVWLGDLRVVDEDGVTFRSHLDGSTHGSRQKSRSPPRRRSGRTSRSRSTSRSSQLAAGGRRRCDLEDPSLGRALAGCPQASGPGAVRHRPGGPRPGAGAASTEFIASLPFDGICLGGLAGDETPRSATRRWTWPAAPRRRPRPRYLMGLGSPADLLEAVHRGVDLFDSVLPARVARKRPAVGTRRSAEHPQPGVHGRSRPRPGRCPCLLCRRFSRAYLAHLFRAKELLAYRLATCHNLTFTLDLIARVRASIRAGTFPASMAEFVLAQAG